MSVAAAGVHARRGPFAAAIFEALVRSSVWVSAAIAATLFLSGHLLGVDVPPVLYVLAFASAMFVMNFDHVVDARFEAPPASAAERRTVRIMGLLAIGAAAVMLYAIARIPASAPVVFSYVAVGVAYGLPIFPLVWRRPVVWRRLKDIRGIKAWLVTASIVFATIALPLAGSGQPASPRTVTLAAAALYLLIVSNAHMFDVRDVVYDRQVGNTTLPTLIGAARTRAWLIAANVAALAAAAAAHFSGFWPIHPELVLGMLLTIAYVRLLPGESSGMRYALIIDGCLFVLPLAARLHELFSKGLP